MMTRMFKLCSMISTVAIFALVAGCNSVSDTETISIDKAGNPIVVKQHESTPPLAKKSLNVVTQTSAVKLTSTPDTSGTSFSILFGTFMTSVHDVAVVKPGEITLRMISYTKQSSIFSMFGSDINSVTFTYTAASNETPEETIKIINTFKDFQTSIK